MSTLSGEDSGRRPGLESSDRDTPDAAARVSSHRGRREAASAATWPQLPRSAMSAITQPCEPAVLNSLPPPPAHSRSARLSTWAAFAHGLSMKWRRQASSRVSARSGRASMVASTSRPGAQRSQAISPTGFRAVSLGVSSSHLSGRGIPHRHPLWSHSRSRNRPSPCRERAWPAETSSGAGFEPATSCL